MNNIITDNIKIENMIYEIRGKQVMIDSDLAKLYECKNGTKVINQAVNRNKERFPNDFYFQLTNLEYQYLKSQIVTSSLNDNYGGNRKLPYVFTEQGVAMLATILRTKVAANISVNIMRAFVSMRKYISTNLLEQKNINNLVLEDHNILVDSVDRIRLLEKSFDKLEEKKVNNEIYFDGQIYDSYSKILDIFSKTKKELIIIDSYADKVILDIISRLKINVIIITKENNLLSKLDVEKYNKQYRNLKVIYDNTFHDRFFIIDKSIVYHCGTSINSIGNKTFAINRIIDNEVINSLLNKINDIVSGCLNE